MLFMMPLVVLCPQLFSAVYSPNNLETGELRLPDTKTGAKVVYLGDPAIAVLRGIDRQGDNPWVIAGRKPESHLTDLQHPWRRIRARAGLDDVRDSRLETQLC